jgi:hypothetical protein
MHESTLLEGIVDIGDRVMMGRQARTLRDEKLNLSERRGDARLRFEANGRSVVELDAVRLEGDLAADVALRGNHQHD